MLVVAILLTLIWTALAELRSPARRSLAYPRLFFWFRLIIRLTLGVAMIGYGLAKLFPLQMSLPNLAVLNEPLGNTSPMTMLWTLIGLNPVYEMICGAAEITAGILILFRRTGLLGELLTAFLATNIVLYNFCYDVPVKIYAAHLLLMSIALIVPDMPGLFNFFVLHRPCKPIDGWVKPARRYGLRVETICVVVALLLAVLPQAFQEATGYSKQLANQRNLPPYTGQWHLTSATKPFLTGDGQPMTDIYFETTGRVMVRSGDGVLCAVVSESTTKNIRCSCSATATMAPPPVYAHDPTRSPPIGSLPPPATMPRAMASSPSCASRSPRTTPLQDRGFHFVNEWGLER